MWKQHSRWRYFTIQQSGQQQQFHKSIHLRHCPKDVTRNICLLSHAANASFRVFCSRFSVWLYHDFHKFLSNKTLVFFPEIQQQISSEMPSKRQTPQIGSGEGKVIGENTKFSHSNQVEIVFVELAQKNAWKIAPRRIWNTNAGQTDSAIYLAGTWTTRSLALECLSRN